MEGLEALRTRRRPGSSNGGKYLAKEFSGATYQSKWLCWEVTFSNRTGCRVMPSLDKGDVGWATTAL